MKMNKLFILNDSRPMSTTGWKILKIIFYDPLWVLPNFGSKIIFHVELDWKNQAKCSTLLVVGRRARPGKVDKTKKVPFIPVISCDWAQHYTCTCNAGVQSSSSSSTAGARSRRKTSSSTRLQPAGGQESAAEVREGLDSVFCNLGIFGNILKFWEHLGNSEIDT